MFFVAYNILGDYHEAEDAVQEAIIAMLKNIKNLRSPEAFDAWMSRIVRTQCYKYVNKRSRARDEVDIDDENIDIEDNDTEFLPEVYAEDAELRDRLYAIIMALPRKRREAIIMYYYEALSYKEIAEILGSSVNAVASNITRARHMIKNALERQPEYQTKLSGRLKGSASALVISKALHAQASQLTPEPALAALRAKWIKTSRSIEYPVSASFVVARQIAIVAVCATVVGGSSIALRAHFTEDAAPSAPVEPKGEIGFVGGEEGADHVNPASSALTVRGVKDSAYAPAWRVVRVADSVTDETVAEGVGYEASEVFDSLEPGEYYMRYDLTDEGGVTVTVRRGFNIE
jgi:RNA polymerase sigma-70 factor (ECF subfamily)